jgi:hypothetical protein
LHSNGEIGYHETSGLSPFFMASFCPSLCV